VGFGHSTAKHQAPSIKDQTNTNVQKTNDQRAMLRPSWYLEPATGAGGYRRVYGSKKTARKIKRGNGEGTPQGGTREPSRPTADNGERESGEPGPEDEWEDHVALCVERFRPRVIRHPAGEDPFHSGRRRRNHQYGEGNAREPPRGRPGEIRAGVLERRRRHQCAVLPVSEPVRRRIPRIARGARPPVRLLVFAHATAPRPLREIRPTGRGEAQPGRLPPCASADEQVAARRDVRTFSRPGISPRPVGLRDWFAGPLKCKSRDARRSP
jgi:hypothetical protein